MGSLVIKTTLWSVYPLDIVSQGETDLGLHLLCCLPSEGLILKYYLDPYSDSVFMSTTFSSFLGG